MAGRPGQRRCQPVVVASLGLRTAYRAPSSETETFVKGAPDIVIDMDVNKKYTCLNTVATRPPQRGGSSKEVVQKAAFLFLEANWQNSLRLQRLLLHYWRSW